MDWTTLTGVALGGLLGIAGTLCATLVTARRDDRVRWDADRLDAAAEFMRAATALEGLHYRRARTSPDDERDRTLAKADAANELANLHASATRVNLLDPTSSAAVAAVFDSERDLRTYADAHMVERTEQWQTLRMQHRAAIDAFASSIRSTLRVKTQ